MIWKSKRIRDRNSRASSEAVRRRLPSPEKLEPRRLFAADPIHVGVVYLETDYLESDQDVGSDSRGDRFILSFTGGAADTELTELRLVTDKDGDGITVGDPIFDTAQGGRGKNGAHGFQVVRVVSSDGRQIDATAEVEDGGQELVLRLSNFQAGDRLEFTLDVDEVLRNAVDLAVFNDRLDVITSGQEFQDSILEATFDAPHFETAHADAIFLNDYGDPGASVGLNLPPDEGNDIDSRPNRSAAAVATTIQAPKPIELSGQVWVDNDLDLIREPGERLLPGVSIELWKESSGGNFVRTGHTATTDQQGRYIFAKSLGLTPGNYRIVQTQPTGFFSVGAVPGTVAGNPTGVVENSDVIGSIAIELGDTSAVNFDFAESDPAALSGFVYQDTDNDGRRDAGETGIAGVRVQLVPINTIATESTLIVTTSGNGSYSFTGLAPGSYEVIQVDQPAGLDDGIDAAGTIDGQVVGVAQNPGDRINGILLGGSDDGVEYNFGETPRGSIGGFVYLAAPGADCDGDHDGDGNTPLAGVAVELQTASGEVVLRTTTGFDGAYLFDDVSVGDYRIVQFTPSGLIDGGSHVGRIDNIRVGTSVDGGLIQDIVLTPAGVGIEYNFCEAAPAAISGYVYQDQSDDGVRDAGESPIAGAVVAILDDQGRQIRATVTDDDGRYEFIGLMPGQYTIVQSQPDGFIDGKDTVGNVRGAMVGQNSANDVFSQITLRQGDIGNEYNFGELVPASLFGRVHVDVDGDCEFDAGEQLLSGVTIRLIDASGSEVDRTTTDSDGQYAFTGIVPGTYTVIQEQPEGFFDGGSSPGSAGGVSLDASRIGSITLASGQTAVEYDFCELPPAQIAGSVFNDRDQDCVFDSDEVGIEGATVELYNDAGELIGTTQTDASGNYQFVGLRAGSYTVREIQPAGFLHGGQRAGSNGGDDSQADVISRVPVGWGERLTDYDFCEIEPAAVSGIVFVDGDGDCFQDAGEPGLEGVVIELRDSAGTRVRQTITDSAGQYRFEGLTPGEYQIFEQQPEGFFQGDQVPGTGDGRVLGRDLLGVTLGSGEVLVDYNFCELPPSSISGMVWQESDPNRVFDPGDSPIPGVVVELIDSAGDVIAQTSTDSAGGYQFDGLAPGVYSVREIQPAGFFHGGQVVGDAGGSIGGDDLLVGITLTGGTTAQDYDFPEIPPGMISGFVFQDGGALVLADAPAPTDLRQFRDGQLTDDDTRIGGVVLELRNLLGRPFDASDALPGIYSDGPIRVTTRADGYYEFVGLPPATYHVYQVQPDSFIDGLDTPGSAGGFAVNPADALADDERIVILTLSANEASNPRDDAILNIELVGGGQSVGNNFSEILIEEPLVQIPQLETPVQEFERVSSPIETFDPRIQLVAFAQPVRFERQFFTDDERAVTWHLSVINGGFPRGSVAGQDGDGVIKNVGFRQDGFSDEAAPWNDAKNDRGRWTLTDREGMRLGRSDQMTLGAEGATALAGDFDGDGVDEGVIYVGGQWFVDFNGNGKWDPGDLWMQLGTLLDRPVVGDWDGDGKDDIGIFGRQWQRDPQRIKRDPGLPDPANKRRRQVDSRADVKRAEDRGEDRKRLLVRGDQGSLRADAVDHVFKYGEQVDMPIAGDWNGDGIDQIAVFRGGHWLLDADGDGRWTDEDTRAKFGRPGDQPVVGDFNGDEIDEIGIVRGDLWIIDTDGDRRITGNDLQIVVPRSDGDSQPVVGDFDGDGKDEPGYYDESA